MKKVEKMIFPLSIFVIILASAFTFKSSLDWKVSEGYEVKFKGTEAEGVFTKMNGSMVFNESELSNATISVSIDVNSINTGNGTKNKHAKSKKWFDAEKYPTIKFNSSKITKSGSSYEAEGTLSMHGIEKTVKIPLTFSSNTFKGELKVNRMDYKIGTMEGMSKKVSNEIKVTFSVPVVKK